MPSDSPQALLCYAEDPCLKGSQWALKQHQRIYSNVRKTYQGNIPMDGGMKHRCKQTSDHRANEAADQRTDTRASPINRDVHSRRRPLEPQILWI